MRFFYYTELEWIMFMSKSVPYVCSYGKQTPYYIEQTSSQENSIV